MSDAKQPTHSPEPWRSWAPADGDCAKDDTGETYAAGDLSRSMYDTTGRIILSSCGNKADARRIVACVNACAGIPTEALEAGALGKLMVKADVAQSAARMQPEPRLGEWNWPLIGGELRRVLKLLSYDVSR